MKNQFRQTILVAILMVFSNFSLAISDPQAFLGWREVDGYVSSRVNLQTLQKVTVDCPKGTALYPTHPQQDTKLYHVFNVGKYNQAKLNGDSEVCALSSKFKNSRGTLTCLAPDLIYEVVISDTYEDACGNLYRGFWKREFKKSEESMGTLFSLGRTLYERPGALFKNDFYVDSTYSLDAKDFLFLTPAFKEDSVLVSQARARILGVTHTYDSQSHLYIYKQ